MSKLIIGSAIIGSLASANAVSASNIRRKVASALTNPPPYRIYKEEWVSVIIPTIEEQDWLEPLLQSIRNQTYSPIEIIISDSSIPEPKEYTRRVAEEYDATLVHSPKLNISAGRNAGAEAAAGDFLIFCDADCILGHHYVEKVVTALNNGARLAHGQECIYDSALDNFLHNLIRPFVPPMWTTGRGIAVRRTDFFDVGGYDEECDPMQNCREDLLFGKDIAERFGKKSLCIVNGAILATSGRRGISFSSKVWAVRGVRNGVVE